MVSANKHTWISPLGFVVSVLLLNVALCDEPSKLQRKLTATLNPGCREFCENNTAITLVHIAATSDTDTIHYVWDFTGKPTILVALTSKQAEFHIDWPRLMESKPGSVRFTEAPQYTFMAIINRIFQYNDADDRAMLDEGTNAFVYDPHNFIWNRSLLWSNEEGVMMAINAGDDFLFKLNAYSTKDHGMDFPHLLHTSNSTQIDIVFNNITNRFANPRFAIELLFVVSEQAVVGSEFEVTKRKTLDDEHTPGIFEIVLVP